MKRLNSLMILGVGIAAGAAGSYWYAHRLEPISTPAAAEQAAPAKTERKIVYYRNPMGLPDTSPVPKKDSMGMDYIPVYADEQDEPGTVRVSLDKVQRIGSRQARRASR
jgi:Cu(I)/Ag(I) efflux system membrane fusion protein